MYKIIFTGLFAFMIYGLVAQGDIASLERPILKGSAKYDGTENYLKTRVFLYIGETLRFTCDSRLEKNDSSFVLGFTEDYKIGRDKYGLIYPKTYHPSSGGIGTDYHKIVNNVFKVLDVISSPKPANKNQNDINTYFLKLHNLSLNDTAYYQYFAENKERYFPFIVTKHFNYLKEQYRGEFYQVLGEQFEAVEVTCNKTQKTIQISGKTWWKCTDLIINDNNCQLSLILENQNQQIIIPATFIKYYFAKN